MSSAVEEPVVVRKSPEIKAFAPERKARSPLLPMVFRPAAHRIVCDGIMKRKTASVRRISSVETEGIS